MLGWFRATNLLISDNGNVLRSSYNEISFMMTSFLLGLFLQSNDMTPYRFSGL